MKTTTTLLSATAITLALGATAFADDNETYIVQSGNDNAALIVQDGSGNFAGQAAEGLGILQTGNNGNVIDIEQTGTDNTVGSTSAGNGASIFQNGSQSRANELTVRQGAAIIGDAAAAPSDGNLVGSVNQRTRFGMTSNHTIEIDQIGAGGNVINSLRQDRGTNNDGLTTGDGNATVIVQSGSGNVIDTVRQMGADNQIDVSFTGTGNGSDGAGGVGALRGVSIVAGVGNSALSQSGQSNTIMLDVDASDTQFGITQIGTGNTVGTLDIDGDGNSIGIYQDGTNTVSMGVIEGASNDIGLSQTGTNTLTLDIVGATSNGNIVSATQNGDNDAILSVTGSTNTLTLTQDMDSGMGGDNDASITVVGDMNAFTVAQAGSNDATVSITGDMNGIGTFRGVASGLGATAGTISQTGGATARNSVNLTIAALDDALSSGNVFGFSQDGNGNGITGSIMGSMNHVAIVQVGDGNVTGFTQTGSNNTIGTTQ